MSAAEESGRFEQPELDQTDKLPVLDVAAYEAGLDETKRDEAKSAEPTSALPSLTESVRSVEEKIARQNAQQESLRRDLDRARAAASAAETRSDALLSELGTLRALLDTERERAQHRDQALEASNGAAERARAHSEQAIREAERLRGEVGSFRETLLARDASLTQTSHSLGERDSQLTALQREQSELRMTLDERAQYVAQLETDLHQTSTQLEAARLESEQAKLSMATLSEKSAGSALALGTAERQLVALRAQLASHHEQLCSREYRRGSDENSMRTLDAEVAAERRRAEVSRAERDARADEAALLGTQLAERDRALAELRGQLDSNTSHLSGKSSELAHLEHAAQAMQSQFATHQAESLEQITALENNNAQLAVQLATQESLSRESERLRAELESRVAAMLAADQTTRLEQELAAAQQDIQSSKHVAQTATTELLTRGQRLQAADLEIASLRDSRSEQDQTLAKLHGDIGAMNELLEEAQRPAKNLEAEVNKLAVELADKSTRIETLNAENRDLRRQYERTEGALHEREFLIRRLERNAANSAQALARVQHSIERLGGSGEHEHPLAPQRNIVTLTRIDGGDAHAIIPGRRTSVGRSKDCDLRIIAKSVSRHHALLIASPHDAIVEDLNSTNGVWINDDKLARGKLSNGDILTIGEVRFRFSVAPANDPAH